MAARHSSKLRGLEAAGRNPNLKGAKFGRMFPDLPGATYGATPQDETDNLTKLAALMVSHDPPKDGADDEESGIPALYTYFGQFIDHDLTFDPNGSFQKQKDPDAREDFRTPAFDLDNVYGRGPGDQPYMYDEDGKSLLLGDPLTMGAKGARDLQRNAAGRALIGDPRNDENAIVSQFQGLMLRFHNGLVKRHPDAGFDHIQAIVRHHYQYVVVNDFLSRIVNAEVLEQLKTAGVYDRTKLKFFTNFSGPYNAPYMPVEFSVAAYRIGHSMVRPGYRLNDTVLLPIFPLPLNMPRYPEGLTGFRRMITDWGIDWGRFIDVDTRGYGAILPDGVIGDEKTQLANFDRLQFAYRIDTSLVEPLGILPMPVAGNLPQSLALRNLERGREFNLPSGQVVAEHMGVTPLKDCQILIGAGVNEPDPPLKDIVSVAGTAFKGNCPLWVYILAEAMNNRQTPDPTIPVTEAKTISTPQLGPVGGRIVAEVFLGILFADPGSYLNANAPGWTPPGAPDFRLKDLVAAALAGE